MEHRPPISSLRQELPFGDPAFSWQTFEAFFCDFLNARPVFLLAENGVEIRGEVIRARPFGRPGDAQEGIDLLSDMVDGDVWDFQCKRVKKWTPEQTRAAIAAYRRDAARRFLLVTCDVSEDCQRVIAEYSGWVLWDAREITRRFHELGAFKGAPIIFTHFGPGWDSAFFGVSGSSPLIAAEAKFQQQLREGRRFHHRHALVGRESLLQQLDDFAESEKARVLLLIGRGGLGKSRLLLEWSRTFQKRHPAQTLRFVFDKDADFGPALQAAPQPMMLVFDDAHRLDDVRHALFPELPARKGIKLVVSLRPGPIGQMMQELLDADFDTTEIVTLEPMKPLSGEQAMVLVDAALQPRFHHLRYYLQAASRDCPLVAVIGAELINSGAVVEADLRETGDFQWKVFNELLRDADPVREQFGMQETDDFLRLLALLGPVKLDAAFFEKAAAFLNIASADRSTRLRDALDAVGLLLTTGAGTRVTPDLLSDHLAYDACYDPDRQSRTFAKRLMESFSAQDFPKLMQHLAEAEWHAKHGKSTATSVVEPLWQWFRERFERSSFYERHKQLEEWANIAYLQPERTLDLAEVSLSLTTALPPQEQWQQEQGWDTHAYALESLPAMLGPVAEHHSEFVIRCFDILWALGKNYKTTDFNNKPSHPLSVMHGVLRFKRGGQSEVHSAALEWVQRLFSGNEWLECAVKPGVLFERLLHPIFATSVEMNWSSGRTFHFHSVPLHLENTAPFREQVRQIWRAILARRDSRLASQLIPTLERGCDIARMGMGGVVSDDFRAAWDLERLKCLKIFEEMARDFSEPIINFQIRRALMRDLRYGKDSPGYRTACRELLASLPNTLDFRIARAALGNAWEEFELDLQNPNRHVEMRAKWETFNRRAADELHETFPADEWIEHLAELDTRWRRFESFEPSFRVILLHIVASYPAEGQAVAKRLLAAPDHPLVDTFDVIVMAATKGDSGRRLELICAAGESESETLRAAVVACCSWWRRDGEMPEAAWRILESLAPQASGLAAAQVTSFVWWNEKTASIRDWNLLTALPFAPDQIVLASSIAARAADLVGNRNVQPDAEAVGRFIARFESLESVEGNDLEDAFQKLGEAFPVVVFLTLWRRNEARKAGNGALNGLPYDFARIPFRKIMDAPEVVAIVADFERRALAGEPLDFDELRLLRRAIQDGSENPSVWLEAAVERATTGEHLHLLRKLGSVGDDENPALAYPQFAKVLLMRARTVSPACHSEVFQKLLHLGGGRGSTGYEPDDEWKALLEGIERLAHQYASDPELGPLFSKMAKRERASMDCERSRRSEDEE